MSRRSYRGRLVTTWIPYWMVSFRLIGLPNPFLCSVQFGTTARVSQTFAAPRSAVAVVANTLLVMSAGADGARQASVILLQL